MGELTYKEYLQPSLLDRLTDNEPDRKQEYRENRIFTSIKLRESVRRDLEWLFNTTNLATADPSINKAPLIARSVLNYGVPEISGHMISSVDVSTLHNQLRQAIWDFEPRIVRDSVKVQLIVDEQKMSHNAMCFEIEAELWAHPAPLWLLFTTEVDLENGTVRVTEMSDRGKH
jgi:type VI secretion system protein ImpF